MIETVSPGTQLQVALLDRNASAVRAWAAVHKDKPLPEEFIVPAAAKSFWQEEALEILHLNRVAVPEAMKVRP